MAIQTQSVQKMLLRNRSEIMKIHDLEVKNESCPKHSPDVQDQSGDAYGPGVDRYGHRRLPRSHPETLEAAQLHRMSSAEPW